MHVNSLEDVIRGLRDVAADADRAFGSLDERALNWQPDASRWSVAQCFEHLVITNGMMQRAAAAALDGTHTRTVWQRLPLVPRLYGALVIRSQQPGGTRKFKTSTEATPAASGVARDVVARFVRQQAELGAWFQSVGERDAARTIMTSPFAGFIVYSVLDGGRVIVAHGRRHFEQAGRVTEAPGFPGRQPSGSA